MVVNAPRTWRPAAVLAALTAAAAPALAEESIYFSREAILRDFFATSERVGYETVVTAEHAKELRAALGYLPPKDRYPIFVARTGDAVDGYAVIDEERGQHLPITIATMLSASGTVLRTEVMVYREGYGDEIRERRFRRQFEGKGPGDDVRGEIVAVSGATISSRSMAVAVERAIALVHALKASAARRAATGGGAAASGAAER